MKIVIILTMLHVVIYVREMFTKFPKNVKTNDLVTGKYRGGAHNKCNINYGKKRYLPVLFHILESYDGHYIISEAFKTNQEISIKRLSDIPNPKE